MGRTLKRVPLDFSWPLNKVWGGYLNPHWTARTACPGCDGFGYSPEAKRISDQWYGKSAFDPAAYGAEPLTLQTPALRAFAERQVAREPGYYGTGTRAVDNECRRLFALWAGQWCHHLIQADVDALVADGRLMDFTRTPRTPEQVEIVKAKIAAGGNSWLPEENGYHPTAAEVNAWSLGGFGHDAINAWICLKARCAREGIETECSMCKGDGDMWPTAEIRAAYDAWEMTEPPEGPGFQLWETTSEGSPTSPVFATIEALCEYAAQHCSTFGSFKASAERWREMLDADFVAHS